MNFAELWRGVSETNPLVSHDPFIGWSVRADGARAKYVDIAYAQPDVSGSRVRIWRPRLADVRGIEALRWRCWERLARLDGQIGELLDRAVPAGPTGGYYAATLFASVGERICGYSVRILSEEQQRKHGRGFSGFGGPTTGRRFEYSSDWSDYHARPRHWPAELEPTPAGQRLRQLDRYMYTLATRLSVVTSAFDLALERRLGKGRDGDVARVLINGREHWASCIAIGKTDKTASPYWRPVDRPEDRRVFTLNLDEEQA